MSKLTVLGRRQVLLGACAACIAACTRTVNDNDASVRADSSGNSDSAPTADQSANCNGLDLGLVSDFAMDTLTLVASAAVIVGRDAMGLWAMSTQCAHLLGTVAPVAASNTVACTANPNAEHGATYDKDGRNTQWVAAGAARPDQTLVNLRITVQNGRACVDPARSVRVGTRVSV